MIDGVAIKKLITYTDERGFFREVIRESDDFFEAGFGQLSFSIVYAGVIKAWHAHKFQTQWTCVVSGLLKVVLYDNRSNSFTYQQKMEFLAGDHQPSLVYSLPPGVLHGYKCIHGPAQVIYVTSGVYDLSDEVRISHDDSEIGYDWSKKQDIK